MSITAISPQQFAKLRTEVKKLDLVDVRTPVEYREVHIDIARNVPLDQLDPAAVMQARIGTVDEPLYVICRSGSRGQQAAEKFMKAGFSNVVNIEGGTLACVEAGLPVARGKSAISLERQVRISAGSLVLLGAVLGWLVHPAFIGLSAFVGAGLLFAGVTDKGGVGKTSVACFTAVELADAGKRVLLVNTDPASNLDELLGVTLGNTPTAVPDVANLKAMNIDPEASAKAYRESMVALYRGVLPDAAVASMEEQFSGSCTLEIAAFDEFARLLGGTGTKADFDHVLFDTAPTGHTLRLLTLPSAWDEF